MNERTRRAFPKVAELLKILRAKKLTLTELDVLVEEIQGNKSNLAAQENGLDQLKSVRGRGTQTEK